MIVPIGHENMSGRRWPIWTIVIIVANFLLFVATHSRIESEEAQIQKLKMDLYAYTLQHPYLERTATAKRVIMERQHSRSEQQVEKLLQSHAQQMYVPERTRVEEQEELNRRTRNLDAVMDNSILYQYGFIPAEKNPLSYFTSMFLHAGWLHLIFNMMFLWLCGCIMEDVWGRFVFPALYVLSGVVALMAHESFYPQSAAPCIGASGAIAGVMGAFLIRFYKTKIHFFYISFLGAGTFDAPAYIVLPFWLLRQLASAYAAQSAASGVAFWAHIGGFVFGACFAVAMKLTGIERYVARTIEQKVTLSGDPRIIEAIALLDQQRPQEAVSLLKKIIAAEPGNLDAHATLLNCYRATFDKEKELEAYRTVVRLHLLEKNYDAALGMLRQIPDKDKCAALDLRDWFALCKYIEETGQPGEAAEEYQNIFAFYPSETAGMKSLLRAAHLYLNKLNDKKKAIALYHKALDSIEPGSQWEEIIRKELNQTEAT
jgi:membrane associated rhomboid family serine protease